MALADVLKAIEALDASAVVSVEIAHVSGMEWAVIAAMGKHTKAPITQSQGEGVDLRRAHVHLKIRPDDDAWLVVVVKDRVGNSNSTSHPGTTGRFVLTPSGWAQP
jgi:hypothetical protein